MRGAFSSLDVISHTFLKPETGTEPVQSRRENSAAVRNNGKGNPKSKRVIPLKIHGKMAQGRGRNAI